jgi:hypothetical protein
MARNIVYFIGAGLTKSLAKQGMPIPLMGDFVQVMAGYASSDPIILTFLAELENAGAFRESCQECRRFAEAVVGKNADRRPETIDAFGQAFRDRPAESIEDLLLRALQIAAKPDAFRVAQLSDPAGAAQRLAYAVNRLFAHWIGWDVDWPPLEKFLRVQFEGFPLGQGRNSHTFVSFNYELILDRAVQGLARDRLRGECWVPSTGYGFEIGHYVEVGLLPARCGAQQYPTASPYLSKPSVGVEILKPHGSLNWLVPYQKPPRVTDYGIALKDGPVFIPLSTGGDLAHWASGNVSDCVSYHPPTDPNHPGEDVRICILPPLPPAKQPDLGFIRKVRDRESEAIRDADESYILGWSMPKTDAEDQLELVRRAMGARGRPIGRVVVVNRHAGDEYFERVKEVFGAPVAEIWNEGFREFVARLPCTGCASKPQTVPEYDPRN